MVSEERRHVVGIFETKIEIINGISSAPVTTRRDDLDLEPLMGGAPGRIVDVKFLDEDVLLALWAYAAGAPQLVSVRYRHYLSSAAAAATRLEFDEDLSAFGPLRMEAMRANDARGGVPARVCLLGRDEVSYKVFALPDISGEGEGEGKAVAVEA